MNGWRAHAACLGLAYDLAFPVDTAWLSVDMVEVCLACPVRRPCLDDALTDPQSDQVGIRGGLYAAQRVAILRGRRLVAR